MDYSSYFLGIVLALVSVVGTASTSTLAFLYIRKLKETENALQESRRASFAQNGELLHSPLKKAFDVLLKLRKNGQASKQDIDFVIHVLVENRESHLPEFLDSEQGKKIDDDTRNWVIETFLHSSKKVGKSEAANEKEEGSSEALFPLRKVISRPLDDIPSNTQEEDKKSRQKSNKPLAEAKELTVSQLDLQKHQLGLRSLQELDHDAIHHFMEDNFSKWDFDVLDFNELTRGHALYFTGLYAFQKHGVLEKWKLPLNVVQNWLLMIEREYTTQPYHFSAHGADVLHAINYLVLENDRVKPKLLADEVFASIVSALGHDIDHPGVNNAFLMKIRDRRALIYCDNSVNENHHCAHMFMSTFMNERYNIFSTLKTEEYEQIRKIAIRLILATDMAKHFQYLTQFKAKCEANSLQDMGVYENRATVLEIAIKCADLSNPAKPTEICKKWVDRVMEEFYSQGDQERARGLPISMFMDRNTTSVPKCQIGFIDFLVAPLYEAWSNYNKAEEDGKYKALVDELKYNRSCWLALSEGKTVPDHPNPPPVEKNNPEAQLRGVS